MKSLEQLIDTQDDAIVQIRTWQQEAELSVTLLPAAANSGEQLQQLQLSTHSVLGALVYHTGGVLIADGWLRFLGSGCPQLTRALVSWNHSNSGYLLVADDVVGGFFAINDGALGSDVGDLYYLPPDALDWEPLEVGFSDFFAWSMSENLLQFYADVDITRLLSEYRHCSTEHALHFYPPLWSQEGNVSQSARRLVPLTELRALKLAN
ncbi:DUF2625 family protein [Shewanella sp.]|uniref:DUF2625 family protein n=1 Tax=Shewanella sp. TaxID=50422 RepID=UPI003A9798A3